MDVKLFGSATGAMSTGQMSEIFFMLVMPFCFARLGVKKMLIIGMLAWAVRYGLWGFAFRMDLCLLPRSFSAFCCMASVTTSSSCWDDLHRQEGTTRSRGQAQSLIVMLTQGSANWCSSLWVVDGPVHLS